VTGIEKGGTNEGVVYHAYIMLESLTDGSGENVVVALEGVSAYSGGRRLVILTEHRKIEFA
jgi:hypothetical protein